MKTLLAVDFDKHAAATYQINFPKVKGKDNEQWR